MDQDANENATGASDMDDYDDTNKIFEGVAESPADDALSATISEMNLNIAKSDFNITMGGSGILPHFFIEHTCFEVAVDFMGKEFYDEG